MPHEWNKVLLDGEWTSVDVTNNDNPDLYNALLNLPDNAASTTLVEDTDFLIDDQIDTYTSASDANEYYHVVGLFYDSDQITSALVTALQSNDSVMMRTDYTLTDAQFQEIGRSVIDQTGCSSLSGYYWMGVIYLQK